MWCRIVDSGLALFVCEYDCALASVCCMDLNVGVWLVSFVLLHSVWPSHWPVWTSPPTVGDSCSLSILLILFLLFLVPYTPLPSFPPFLSFFLIPSPFFVLPSSFLLPSSFSLPHSFSRLRPSFLSFFSFLLPSSFSLPPPPSSGTLWQSQRCLVATWMPL